MHDRTLPASWASLQCFKVPSKNNQPLFKTCQRLGQASGGSNVLQKTAHTFFKPANVLGKPPAVQISLKKSVPRSSPAFRVNVILAPRPSHFIQNAIIRVPR